MPAPANDNFANAQLLTGASGASTTVVVDDATVEGGEPAAAVYSGSGPFQTAWYKWIPPAGGTATINLAGSLIGAGFGDWIVAVYVGTALANLVELAEGWLTHSADAVNFNAAAGVTYWIQVGTFGGEVSTSLKVNWAPLHVVPPGPPALWTVDHLEHEFLPVVVGLPGIDPTSIFLIEEVRPENLHFVLRLGVLGAEDIDYEISRQAVSEFPGGAAVSDDFVGAYRTDFLLRRSDGVDDLIILTGMHTTAPSGTDGATPNEVAKIAGKGYLHYLEKRMWPYDADLSYVDWPDGFRFNVKQAEIGQMVKDILETVRDVSPNWPSAPDAPGAGGHPSYSLQYTVDCDSTGHNRNYEIAAFESSSILQLITTLAQAEKSEGGFDFYMDIDADTGVPFFRLVSPQVGNPDAPIFTLQVDATTHHANLLEAGFTNTGPEATHVLGLGAGTSTRQGGVNKHSRENSARYRRLDKAADFGEVKDLDTLEGLTVETVGFGLQPVHEIPITVNPADILDFWKITRPGKYIEVIYEFGWHTVNSVQRIVEMDCTVDTEGNETVVLSLNQYYNPNPADPVTDW